MSLTSKIKKALNLLTSPVINYKNKYEFRKSMQFAYYSELQKIDEKMIFFESFHGNTMSCNPYAIYKAMISNNSFNGYTFVWALNDPENNEYAKLYKKNKNTIFVKRNSKEYIKYLTKAKYLINNNTFHYFFTKRPEQIYINTWHGTPLKTLGKDIKGTLGQHKNTTRNFLQADYLIMPNKYTSNIIINSHDLEGTYNGKIAEIGYPRVDLTLNSNVLKIKKFLKNAGVNIDPNKKIVLYAPTWRGEIGKAENNNIKTYEDIKKLHQSLPSEYQLLVKVHNLTYKFVKNKEELKKILIPNWIDTNELLSVVDILITDYSSIFFDFLKTKKPIIFHVYDKDEYNEKRGLYLDLNDLPGPLCNNVEEILSCIRNIDSIKEEFENKYNNMLNIYAYLDDGKATKRFIDTIFNKKETSNIYSIQNNKKKILIYGGGFTTNGVTSSVLSLLNNIDYSNYDVTLIFGGKIDEDREFNLRKLPPQVKIVYRMTSFNFRLLEFYKHRIIMTAFQYKWVKNIIPEKLYTKEKRRLLGDTKYDIGIDFSGYSAFWTLFFAFNDFNNKIIYLHNDMEKDSNRTVNGKKLFRKNFDIIFYLYRYFDKLVNVSQSSMIANVNNLAKYNIDINKMVCVNNALNHKRVLDGANKQEFFESEGIKYLTIENQESHGLKYLKGVVSPDKSNINFINIARLSPEKDHEKLIKAFNEVAKVRNDVRLYIVGNGPLKNYLNNLIKKLGLQEKVIMVGLMNNPFALLNQCDCFVLSSKYEGQGLVLLEALILEKSIISVDIPGPHSVLENGYGKLIENNQEALTDAMLEFAENKEKIETNKKKFDYIKYNQEAMEQFYKLFI